MAQGDAGAIRSGTMAAGTDSCDALQGRRELGTHVTTSRENILHPCSRFNPGGLSPQEVRRRPRRAAYRPVGGINGSLWLQFAGRPV